ncbi:MAG: ATP-binding protein [Lachnospira sp.]
MALTNTQHDAVMRIYDDIRARNSHIQARRYEETVSLCPEIKEIEDAIISASMKEAVSRINMDSSSTNLDEFDTTIKSLTEKKKALLESLGKPSDYLDNIYTCPICKDTGYDSHGAKCSCFRKKAIDLVYRDSNLKNITADENFSTFSFDWYNNTDMDSATGLTPYNNMHKVLEVCQSFVKNFDKDFSNLLLYGNTGVGKTFLANCIAKELLDTSHSVIYLTAIELFNCFTSSDFNRGDDSYDLSYLLDCDLLIIDDLGTENGNTYTNSRLFYLINERILRRKSVIISTNYSISQIEDAYSERIFSRIISAYEILKLFGDDIRLLKKMKR